jgi:hypothetical protein
MVVCHPRGGNLGSSVGMQRCNKSVSVPLTSPTFNAAQSLLRKFSIFVSHPSVHSVIFFIQSFASHSLSLYLAPRSCYRTLFRTTMQLLTTLLLSAAAVLAAPTDKTDVGYSRMSDNDVLKIYHTCHDGAIKWPIAGRPNPIVNTEASQLKLYTPPKTTANMLTIHNYCNYPIDFDHWGQAKKIANGTLSASGTWGPEALSGSVWKARKQGIKPLQGKPYPDLLVEYVVVKGRLTYDISLITCLGEGMDTSACPGHEAGLNLGNKEWKSFQCGPGKWCDDQVYLYEVS